jgi:hypothetical protein
LIMRGANIIRMLTQVMSLAMVTLALMAGSSFAHGGPAASHDHAAMQVQAQAAEQQPGDSAAAVATSLPATAIQNAVKASAGETPCSNDHRSGSDSEGCCTIACHAALAAPIIEPLGAHEPASVRIVALADMLEGRSGDRTERPPRLS